MFHVIWEEPSTLEYREKAIRRGAKVMCREAACLVRAKQIRVPATIRFLKPTPFVFEQNVADEGQNKASGIWA